MIIIIMIIMIEIKQKKTGNKTNVKHATWW